MYVRKWNRLLAFVLTIVILMGMSMPATAVQREELQLVTADSIPDTAMQASAEEPEFPEEPQYDYHDVVRVSILMEEKSTIAAGYQIADIGTNQEAMAYREHLDASLDVMTREIERSLGFDLEVLWKLTLAANLISVEVPYGRIEQIRNIPGVAQVVLENRYTPAVVSKTPVADPNMGTSGSQTGSYTAWTAGYTGAGSRIAIIDTGLDVLHEAFDADAFAYSLEQLENAPDLMDAADIAEVLQQLNVLDRMEVTAQELYVSGKVPFGFNYVDGDLDVSHYNNEHGSHVAGIAAANSYVKKEDSFVPALSNTCVQGMAPDAQILVMKVFGTNGGAYDSDYMAAIEDAILLGADAVNLSLGSASSGFSTDSVYQDLLDSLAGSGVVVTMSAGNNGAWDDHMLKKLLRSDVSFHTAGSPGTYTNSLSVASVENDGITDYAILVNSQVYCYRSPGGTTVPNMTQIPGEQEYVFISDTATIEQVQANSDLFAGRIAVYINGADYKIWTGTLLPLEPSGIIVCGSTPYYPDIEMREYTNKPVVVCTGIAADALRENAQAVEETPFYVGKLTALSQKASQQLRSEYYTMSSFSGWGVPGSLELKPEITAPGGNIYSVAGYVTNVIKDHSSYEAMSGTSMAAPQVAGMVALLAQYFRENSFVERTGLDPRVLAQSLLMSTAVPMMDETSRYYYPVIQQGAGLANVGYAVTADSYLLMGSDATASWKDGKIKAELGDDPDRTGVYTFSFRIFNPGDAEAVFGMNADMFIQGSDAAGEYTLRTTQPLLPDVKWKVNGQNMAAARETRVPDLNGDGTTNARDAQLILEYAAGNLQTFQNLLQADLDENGQINTYDAYLYMTLCNSAGTVVPAKGSVTVEVTVTLSQEDRAILDNDPNGAFIQGYVFAESTSGTVHSIPVLGYYGDWSEPSMFDPQSSGVSDRVSYVHTRAGFGNHIRMYRPWGASYTSDYASLSEKSDYNAISAAERKWIDLIQFTLIRDAAMGVYFVRNVETGEFIETENLGALSAVYYNTGTRSLEAVYYEMRPYFVPDGIPEGTKLELGVAMFTEYHVKKGYTLDDIDKLGDGGVYSVQLTVDDTKPVIESYSFSDDRKTLTVTVSDNHRVLTTALFNQFHNTINGTERPAYTETDDGKFIYTFTFQNNENHASFFIQAVDYAGNITSTYVEESVGTTEDDLTNVGLNKDKLLLNKGETYQLTAYPEPSSTYRDFVWESSDTSVASVDQNGLVTARGTGVAYITASAAIDSGRYETCAVTVTSGNVKIQGILADGQGTSQMFDWKMETPNTRTTGRTLDFQVVSATKDTRSGNLLVMDARTLQISSVDPNTGSIKKTGVNDIGVPFWDMAYSQYFSSAGNPKVHGIYGNYFLPAQDPFAPTSAAFNVKQTLVGITSLGYAEKTYQYKTYDTEHIILLCENGSIMHFWVYQTEDGGFGALTETQTTSLRDHDIYFIPKNGNMNTSLLSDKSGNLYFSTMLGTRTVLYRLVAGKRSNGNNTVHTQFLTMFERGVGPAAIVSLTVDGVTTYSEENTEPTGRILAAEMQPEAKPMETVHPQIPVRSEGAAQTVQPQYLNEYKTFRLAITARDSTGAQVESGNGLLTVTYDPEKLELKNIKLPFGYTAVNRSQAGTLTLAYVNTQGIPAGEPVLELEFFNSAMVSTSVKITHREYADKTSGYEETVKPVVPVEWVQATASLEGNIALNFYLKLVRSLSNDLTAFIRFTCADTVTDIPFHVFVSPFGEQSSAGAVQVERRYSCPINAKNMVDPVHAQVQNYSGVIGEDRTLAVTTYCNHLIRNSNNPILVSLMKAMLNYGAAAQMMFDYKTDNLANKDLNPEDRVLADVDASAYAHSVTGREAGIYATNATLVLETETTIRVYFQLDTTKPIDQYTFTVDGNVVQPVPNGNTYYVEIPDIAAQDLEQMHTVQVGGLTVRYGGLSYVNQINNLAAATNAQKDMAKALFAYWKAAEDYFNSL